MRFPNPIAAFAALAIGACTTSDPVSAPAGGPSGPGQAVLEAGHANDWILIDPQGRRLSPEEALAKRAYDTRPYIWKKSTLTYAFEGTWDSRAKNLVNMAFLGIGSVVPLEFQATSDLANADYVLVLQSAAEMGILSGETESTLQGPDMDHLSLKRARVRLAYYGHRMATRDNEFLNVAMHEIAHGTGMKHSQYSTAMMYATYQVVNGVPRLYFLADDDIQGLQSLYGSVAPRYPTWNHRYTIVTKAYISSAPPYPGAPPIGWVNTADSYPLWTSTLNRFYEINTELFRVNVIR